MHQANLGCRIHFQASTPGLRQYDSNGDVSLGRAILLSNLATSNECLTVIMYVHTAPWNFPLILRRQPTRDRFKLPYTVTEHREVEVGSCLSPHPIWLVASLASRAASIILSTTVAIHRHFVHSNMKRSEMGLLPKGASNEEPISPSAVACYTRHTSYPWQVRHRFTPAQSSR
jgi:hypothetical protein